MISVIIPTVWLHPQNLCDIVNKLTDISCVGEIIIIVNNKFDVNFSMFNTSKVLFIMPDKNIGCNPAWNLGYKIASNDKLLFLNDDFSFDFNIIEKIEPYITENVGMIGSNPDSDHTDLPLRLVPSRWPEQRLPSGFACAFFIHKNVYKEHVIPDELKLHCGDNWLLDTSGKQHYIIHGTSFSKTVSGTIPVIRSMNSNHPLFIESSGDERLYEVISSNCRKYVTPYATESIIL